MEADEPFSVTIRVTNRGPSVASGVVVSDRTRGLTWSRLSVSGVVVSSGPHAMLLAQRSVAGGAVASRRAPAMRPAQLESAVSVPLVCLGGRISFQCTLPQLAPGTSVTFLVTVTGPPGTAPGTQVCNTTQVTPVEPDTSPALSRGTACVTITAEAAAEFVPVTG
jgi:hypothetical protein